MPKIGPQEGYYDALVANVNLETIVSNKNYIITKTQYIDYEYEGDYDFNQIVIDVKSDNSDNEEYNHITIDTYNVINREPKDAENHIEVMLSIMKKNEKSPENPILLTITPNSLGTLYSEYKLYNSTTIDKRQRVGVPSEKTYKSKILKFIIKNTNNKCNIQMYNALKDVESILDDVLAFFMYYHTYPKTDRTYRTKRK